MRSRTGEEIYRNDNRFNVKSAGIDLNAEVQVNESLLEWAEYVVVMEELHSTWIKNHFPTTADGTEIITLDIPDAYYFMEEELIILIKEKCEEKLKTIL